MGRTPCCSQVGLHRGPWTAKEDNLLTRWIEWHGEGDWRNLPEKAGLLRCGKSCRLRWLNYLRPTIKRGNISSDEEDLIIRLHRLLGNRWSLIAGRLPGRTDNEIKNYWNSHLRKKLRKQGIDPATHKPLESKHHVHKNTEDDHTHENNKASSLEDGQVQTGQNEEVGQARESPSTDYQYAATLLMQQPVHLPKANRYISFPPGINSNHDDSEGMDSHIKKSMQGAMDDLRHSSAEPLNQLDSLYSSRTFKSDPCPPSKYCDSVLQMQSPSSLGIELHDPQHQYHLFPFIDSYSDYSDNLQFCNLEGGSEFMIQNVFQDYSSLILECDNLNPGKLSLSDIKATPHPKPSSIGYEFQDIEWPDCPMEGRIEDILTL